MKLHVLLLLAFLSYVAAFDPFVVWSEEGESSGSFLYHVNDGWHYHFNQRRVNAVYLRCVQYGRTNVKCHGTAIVSRHTGFRHSQVHNHGPDIHYADELALRRNILRRCRALERTPYSLIVRQEQRRFHREVALRVTHVRMRTAMRNARMNNYPGVPMNLLGLTEILRDDRYAVITMTSDGQDNIYGGSVTDAQGFHHVLLASRRMLDLLSRVELLFSDGTFKVVPAIDSLRTRLAQVFCIVTSWDNTNIPLAYVLMEHRTQPAYEAVLQLIRSLVPTFRLNRAICDEETAQQNAWSALFPGIRIQSCLWHIARAFVSEIFRLRLGRWMVDPDFPQFRLVVRMACVLPLLPAAMLRLGWRILRREARVEGGDFLRVLLQPFFDYLWVDWVNHDRRRLTMSCFRSEHLTNNCCESNNAALGRHLGAHPNIYTMLRELVEMEATAYEDYLRMDRAMRPARQRCTSAISNEESIRNLNRDLMRPPFGIEDAIRRFLREAALRVDTIVREAVQDNVPRNR